PTAPDRRSVRTLLAEAPAHLFPPGGGLVVPATASRSGGRPAIAARSAKLEALAHQRDRCCAMISPMLPFGVARLLKHERRRSGLARNLRISEDDCLLPIRPDNELRDVHARNRRRE